MPPTVSYREALSTLAKIPIISKHLHQVNCSWAFNSRSDEVTPWKKELLTFLLITKEDSAAVNLDVKGGLSARMT